MDIYERVEDMIDRAKSVVEKKHPITKEYLDLAVREVIDVAREHSLLQDMLMTTRLTGIDFEHVTTVDFDFSKYESLEECVRVLDSAIGCEFENKILHEAMLSSVTRTSKYGKIESIKTFFRSLIDTVGETEHKLINVGVSSDTYSMLLGEKEFAEIFSPSSDYASVLSGQVGIVVLDGHTLFIYTDAFNLPEMQFMEGYDVIVSESNCLGTCTYYCDTVSAGTNWLERSVEQYYDINITGKVFAIELLK